MLNATHIDRTLLARDNDRLLRELGRNGLVMPLPLRARLGHSDLGAAALGLRRLVELSFGPTPVSLRLARELVDAVLAEESPLADPDGRACPILTAAVAAALGRMLSDYAGQLGRDADTIRDACHRATARLAAMQQPDGLFDGPDGQSGDDRPLGSAFIAYLMAHDDLFGQLAQRSALLSALEEAYDHCDPATCQLIDMARLLGGRGNRGSRGAVPNALQAA